MWRTAGYVRTLRARCFTSRNSIGSSARAMGAFSQLLTDRFWRARPRGPCHKIKLERHGNDLVAVGVLKGETHGTHTPKFLRCLGGHADSFRPFRVRYRFGGRRAETSGID